MIEFDKYSSSSRDFIEIYGEKYIMKHIGKENNLTN